MDSLFFMSFCSGSGQLPIGYQLGPSNKYFTVLYLKYRLQAQSVGQHFWMCELPEYMYVVDGGGAK